MTPLLLAFADKKPSVDVSGHSDLVTNLLLGFIAIVVTFFLVRPELFRRLFMDRVDPRPAALMRIWFGFWVLWTFVDLTANARWLFTDEGLWLTNLARKNYGGHLKILWDPEQGFEHWWYFFYALWGKFTILHFRSDPAFVYTIYTLMMTSLVLVILGVWTRWTTILSWILVEQVYRYSPIFYTGGDTVVRVFMFLSIFVRWGEAYSLDRWWRVRKALRGGATEIPPLRRIPAWPMRLMMVQLTCIYCATGLLKSGGTWKGAGSALYFALNLDHFYRVPATRLVTWMQYLWLLKLGTWITRWWEMLFPLALVGAALQAYRRDRALGVWVSAPLWRRGIGWVLVVAACGIGAYVGGVAAFYYFKPSRLAFPVSKEQLQIAFTVFGAVIPVIAVSLYLLLSKKFPRAYKFVLDWVLGKRLWLGLGVVFHIGIDIGMNVGTFANVVSATFLCWMSGTEVEHMWRFVFSRAAAPGHDGRPDRKRRFVRALLAPTDRLIHRRPGPTYTVHHHPSDAAVRRCAFLRPWDLGHRLAFEEDAGLGPSALRISIDGRKESLSGPEAGAALTAVFPGLWWLRPAAVVPGLQVPVGRLALRILQQR